MSPATAPSATADVVASVRLGLTEAFEAADHPRDRDGKWVTFFHGTSRASGARLLRNGLSRRRPFFMAVHEREEAFGSDHDEAVVEVRSTARSPLHVVVPPFDPDAPGGAEHRRVLRHAMATKGLRLSDADEARIAAVATSEKRQQARDRAIARALLAAGHDALHVEFNNRSGREERWLMALKPEAAKVVRVHHSSVEAAVRSVMARNLRAGHRLHRTSGVQTVADVQTVRGALTGEKRRVILDGGDVEHFNPEERVSVSSTETVESRVAEAVAETLRVEEAADSLVKASTPEPFSSSRTSNWVARAGGLPPYIQHIAHDLMEKRGKSESNAIQMAIGIVKRWARGGGNVDANTRAAAAKAVAQWEAMKAKNRAKSVAEATEISVLESWWEASESAEVVAEAERYETAQDELLAITEAASTRDDADEGKMNSGKRADGLKVTCPKCKNKVSPKDGRCPDDGTDLSKLARFAKSLKNKAQEAAPEHAAAHAIREALEEL